MADDLATLLRRAATDVPEGTFSVEIVAGPDRGKTFEIDGSSPSRILVGSSAVCDLRLRDPTVSRRHCALEIVEARLRISDLGSSNGTLVERVMIGEAFLRGGETITLGDTVLTVRHEIEGVAQEVPMRDRFGRVLGKSRAMRRLYQLADRLAASAVPAIIEGETGTGKEVLAESLHELGPRAAQPFVVFDCTAVAKELVEAELFGHERGAFTGAVGSRKGVFELAHGGTLLIDEIGDLDPSLQPKLLRALDRSEVRPVGSSRTMKVDVRVLAATRRDLDREVSEGRFRDDLFHRLAIARIELPPLRERHGDVPFLAQALWGANGGVGAPPTELLERWEQSQWPGNVRELRNAVVRAIALGEEAAHPVEARPRGEAAGDFIAEVLAAGVSLATARERVTSELERRYIEQTLREHGGNVTHAAAASGIARRHFQRLRAKSK